jgi:hypothetical protein
VVFIYRESSPGGSYSNRYIFPLNQTEVQAMLSVSKHKDIVEIKTDPQGVSSSWQGFWYSARPVVKMPEAEEFELKTFDMSHPLRSFGAFWSGVGEAANSLLR